MSDEHIIERFDEWLRDGSSVAALVMHQWLEPVEGKDAIIFPPTYTLSDTDVGGRFNKGERVAGVYKGTKGPYGYNIDQLEGGASICQIDSVGSQANRMEPIFMRDPYNRLVPQITIQARTHNVNLLEAGHRAADAIVRFSDLSQELEEAFRVYDQGDASKMAKIAPTSLVFGAWDSRATQVKLARIVRSVIRAYNVAPVHRSAQYIPPLDYVANGLLEQPQSKTQQDAFSDQGLSHAPAPWTHGGVQVLGEIRRNATLNLAALRALGCGSAGEDAVLKLRRYVLGLALVCLTSPPETALRQGCELVPCADRQAEWRIVRQDGTREPLELNHQTALAYAIQAAEAFGVGASRRATFDPARAQAVLGQSQQERKTTRRRGRSASEE